MPDTVNSDVILKAKRGDIDAIALIYRRFNLDIFRYLFYRVNNQQAAEDITSDVFLRMIQSLPNYRLQGSPFQAWLFRIAHNLAIDFSRKASNRNQTQLTKDLVANDPDPAQVSERNLTSERLNLALTELGQDQRDVIALRFVVCLSIADTALVLNKSQDAVKGLQRRALTALRNLLTDLEVHNV
ncbi:MAG: sigma-70 family RNA polymerase sigma factor [Chloroflexota bacterium]|nr:sigma-70 family RNA polymerase sigma factor [Chloroflexota bacterium]